MRRKLDLYDLIFLNTFSLTIITIVWQLLEKIILGKLNPNAIDSIVTILFALVIEIIIILYGYFRIDFFIKIKKVALLIEVWDSDHRAIVYRFKDNTNETKNEYIIQFLKSAIALQIKK